MLDGVTIDSTVVGGPAHNSGQLTHGDTVVSIDGQGVTAANIRDLLVGSDVPGSEVVLEVEKRTTSDRWGGGKIFVSLRRMDAGVLGDKRAMFEIFTELKTYTKRDGFAKSEGCVDDCISLWTKMIISEGKHEAAVARNVQARQADLTRWVRELRQVIQGSDTSHDAASSPHGRDTPHDDGIVRGAASSLPAGSLPHERSRDPSSPSESPARDSSIPSESPAQSTLREMGAQLAAALAEAKQALSQADKSEEGASEARGVAEALTLQLEEAREQLAVAALAVDAARALAAQAQHGEKEATRRGLAAEREVVKLRRSSGRLEPASPGSAPSPPPQSEADPPSGTNTAADEHRGMDQAADSADSADRAVGGLPLMISTLGALGRKLTAGAGGTRSGLQGGAEEQEEEQEVLAEALEQMAEAMERAQNQVASLDKELVVLLKAHAEAKMHLADIKADVVGEEKRLGRAERAVEEAHGALLLLREGVMALQIGGTHSLPVGVRVGVQSGGGREAGWAEAGASNAPGRGQEGQGAPRLQDLVSRPDGRGQGAVPRSEAGSVVGEGLGVRAGALETEEMVKMQHMLIARLTEQLEDARDSSPRSAEPVRQASGRSPSGSGRFQSVSPSGSFVFPRNSAPPPEDLSFDDSFFLQLAQVGEDGEEEGDTEEHEVHLARAMHSARDPGEFQ
ncbi:hypothetical protein T484DRAFT_1946187 [Baffinella frigidus]|nr:hypothetical protein T484DRAFT_1946187 [Cryptophyta sp. CCMP2293]